MPEQGNPTPPNASQAQPGPSQPPPPPGYQYGGWYIPAQPPPPPAQQPTGGKPDWLTGWKLLVVLGCVAFVCLYGVIGSLNLGNQASRTAARAMQTGPRLTPKQQIDAQNELDQRQKKLAKDQEELRKRQEKILGGQTGEASKGTTATAGNTTAGNSTTSGNANTGQVSQTQKVLEDIRAERLKQQYASLWTSPIVAVREVEVADGATATAPAISGTIHAPSAKPSTPTIEASASGEIDPNQRQFPYDHSTGPYHVIQKGTVIGATLMLDLDGERGGPVVAQIDKDDQVYVRNTDILLWPEGTEVIGTAQPVAAGNQRLLGVSFESVVMQDGYAMTLTKPVPGLSQQGQGGLAGQVNTHWTSKLGWSLAIGAIEGLSTGSIGFGTNSGAAVILRTPGADMSQLFGGILNRANGVKIPAGTRIKIILTDDLPGNPEYANHQMQPGVL